MRLTKKYLRKLVLEEFRILLEEEGEEDAAEEEGGEEAEEGGDDAEAEEEPAEEVKLDAEEEATLSKSADDQILAHIIDFETNAIKSASLVSDDELRPDPDGTPIDIATESKWYKKSLKNMLFEEEGAAEGMDLQKNWVGSPDIDISIFASDVARLIAVVVIPTPPFWFVIDIILVIYLKILDFFLFITFKNELIRLIKTILRILIEIFWFNFQNKC